MMFWFNKWYSKQQTDYNAVARHILILSSRLPDSHSPTSTLAHSRFSTNTVRLLNWLTLSLVSLCLFPPYRARFRKRPWPGSRRPFPRNYSLERTDDTLVNPTMPRLSRHCLWFGRYLKPFVHDTTYMLLGISLKELLQRVINENFKEQ